MEHFGMAGDPDWAAAQVARARRVVEPDRAGHAAMMSLAHDGRRGISLRRALPAIVTYVETP